MDTLHEERIYIVMFNFIRVQYVILAATREEMLAAVLVAAWEAVSELAAISAAAHAVGLVVDWKNRLPAKTTVALEQLSEFTYGLIDDEMK